MKRLHPGNQYRHADIRHRTHYFLQVFTVPGFAVVLPTKTGQIRFTPLFFSIDQLETSLQGIRKLTLLWDRKQRALGRLQLGDKIALVAAQLAGEIQGMLSISRKMPHVCAHYMYFLHASLQRDSEKILICHLFEQALANLRFTSSTTQCGTMVCGTHILDTV